ARFPADPAKNADTALAFMNSRGILVREMRSYNLPDYLRFSVGTEEEMKIVVDTLAEFLT
ncbi:MAG: histidinol-phosphate transaminase, partial [Oceanibaculum sp.]|nr:histidinol-phosphate transaminase [Oceanibaculum sp.]